MAAGATMTLLLAAKSFPKISLHLAKLDVSPSSQEPSAVSLELDDQVCDPEVPLLLEVGEHTGAEEDLGLTDPVEAGVQLQGLDHLLARLLAVHEPLGDHVGGEQLVSLSELLEGDPVGESLATDPDSLEDTVAPQLVQDEPGVDLAGLLVVVGDDAPHEVGVGVPQGEHELAELLLVQLGHRPEHAPLGDAPELGVGHRLLGHAHNLGCKDSTIKILEILTKDTKQRQENISSKVPCMEHDIASSYAIAKLILLIGICPEDYIHKYGGITVLLHTGIATYRELLTNNIIMQQGV